MQKKISTRQMSLSFNFTLVAELGCVKSVKSYWICELMQDHGREHVKQNKLHKQKEVEFIAISLKTPMFQVEKSSKCNCQVVPILWPGQH